MRITNKEINNLSRLLILIFSSLFLILVVVLAIVRGFASANIEEEGVATDWLTARMRAETIVLAALTETTADYLSSEEAQVRQIDPDLVTDWIHSTIDAASLYETGKNDPIISDMLKDIYVRLAYSALVDVANRPEEEAEEGLDQILYAGALAYEKSKDFLVSNSLSTLPSSSFLLPKVLAATASPSSNNVTLNVNSIFEYIKKIINTQKDPKNYLPQIYLYLDSIFNYSFFESSHGTAIQTLQELKEKIASLGSREVTDDAKRAILQNIDMKIMTARRLSENKPKVVGRIAQNRTQASTVHSQQKSKQSASKTTPRPQTPQTGASQGSSTNVPQPNSVTTAPPQSGTQTPGEKTHWVYRYKANADNISYALIWKNPPQNKKPLIEGSLNNDLKAADLKELAFKDENDPLATATIMPVGWRDKPGERFAYPAEPPKETNPWKEKVSETTSKAETIEAVNLNREVGDFYGLIKVLDTSASPDKEKKKSQITFGKVIGVLGSIVTGGRIRDVEDLKYEVSSNFPSDLIDSILNGANRRKTVEKTDNLTNEEIEKILSELKNSLLFARAVDVQSLELAGEDVAISFAGKLSMEDGQMYLRLLVPKLSLDNLDSHLESDKRLLEKPSTSESLKEILRASIQAQETVIKKFQEGKYGANDGFNVVEGSLQLPSEPIPLTFVENKSAQTVYGEMQPGEYVWKTEGIPVSFKTIIKKQESKRRTIETEATVRGKLSIIVVVEKPANQKQGLETVPLVNVQFSPSRDDSDTRVFYEQKHSNTTVAERNLVVNQAWQHSALKEYALSLFEKNK